MFRAGMAGKLVLTVDQAASLREQLESVLLDVYMRTRFSEGEPTNFVAWLAELVGGAAGD